MSDYRFIISLFGEKHLGMLLVNLYSIQKNAPRACATVFWQEVSKENKDIFKKTFPSVIFEETNFDIASTKIKRISSKTMVWNYAALAISDERVCFIDVDMLVLRDIGKFFETDFDILFTDKKEEIFPLNTGVMLSRASKRKIFFGAWLDETIKILKDKAMLDMATSKSYPFGGADQMAFYNIVNYEKNKSEFRFLIKGEDIKAVSVPCRVLNQTKSGRVEEDTNIIHYKGGWQMILLEGRGFTPDRPKSVSWPMYMLYLRTYKEALGFLNEKTTSHFPVGSFGIVIPFYLDRETLKENKLLYMFFSAMAFFDRLLDSVNIRFNRLVQ